jgi:membrane protease YdiL (CAAX protease family)
MDSSQKTKMIWLVVGLGIGLLFMGLLRFSTVHPNVLTPIAGFATPGYILITVFFTILLVRAGLSLNKFGFGNRLDFHQILLALGAIAILRLFDIALNPLIEELFGSTSNLERFSNIEGSVSSLLILLVINWTLAAFGEEFTYRIVLMRGLSFIFGDKQKSQIFALMLQALMFGLIHAYQGPVGIVGSTFSGLVFGTVTIMSRRSIWPAALAHGTNNTIGIITLYLG